MSQINNQQDILNSYSLIAFASNFGPRIQLATFTNKQDGEQFKSLVFTNNSGDRTLVGFSSKLGELTPKEISEQKQELNVVELKSHNYYLCRQAENSWEEVTL